MSALKRKQSWPLGVEKGARVLMQTKSGQLQMLGHCVGEYFYTPDIGNNKWEIWNLSDLSAVPTTFKNNLNKKMLHAERVGKNVICPKCGHQFPIKEHVVPAPKGSGGCKAFATCPNCGCVSCACSDSCDNEPALSI